MFLGPNLMAAFEPFAAFDDIITFEPVFNSFLFELLARNFLCLEGIVFRSGLRNSYSSR